MFAATKSFFAKAPAGGALTPSWSIDWSTGTPSGYTLTRTGTGATFVDSSGYIASAAADVARLTHNSSGNRLGLLVEESRTNEFQYSEDPANAYWTKSSSGINNNSGAFWTAPDNASTAVLLRQNTSTAAHYMSRTVGSQTARMNSVFVKKQNLTGGSGRAGKYATLLLARSGTEYYHATFDLDAGTVTQSAVVGTVISSTDRGIEAFKDDWYRIWVRGTASSSGNMNFVLALATNDSNGTPTMTANGESYAGANATDGIYIWGMDGANVNVVPTSYIKTPSNASVTRSADLAHVLDSAITSWGDPGALVVHFYPPGQAGTLLSTDDVANEQLGIQANTVTQARAFWSSGNTNAGTIGTGVQKAVHYWNGTNSRFCINGGTVESSTNNITTFGNIDYVTFGAEATSSTAGYSQYANCIIRYIAFYSGTLTDANLQTIIT
jgi:hypothetical protein